MELLKGTHDSGAYTFTSWIGNIGLVKAQAQTQTLSIEQQVAAGYRLFDLRIRAYKDQYYLSHRFYCEELGKELSHLSNIDNVWINVRADLNYNNLNIMQRLAIKKIFSEKVPKANVSCNSTSMQGVFPNLFDEIGGLTENPADLLNQVENRIKNLSRPSYICFIASSTVKTAITRTLKGQSLLDIAKQTNKYLPDLIKLLEGKDNIIGYAVDGAL